MQKPYLVNGLGLQNLIDHVTNRSTLQKDQFVFAMLGGDGYAHFLVAQDGKIIDLGNFSYDRFIRVDRGTSEDDIFAISRFLNLCIEKLKDPRINVPILTGNPDMWNKYYIQEKV